MVRGLAEQSGGGLSIESTVGHGTIASFWFPVVASGAVQVTPPPDYEDLSAVRTQARDRFLIVDDDAIIRETLAQPMAVDGYAALVAIAYRWRGARGARGCLVGKTGDIGLTRLSNLRIGSGTTCHDGPAERAFRAGPVTQPP